MCTQALWYYLYLFLPHGWKQQPVPASSQVITMKKVTRYIAWGVCCCVKVLMQLSFHRKVRNRRHQKDNPTTCLKKFLAPTKLFVAHCDLFGNLLHNKTMKHWIIFFLADHSKVLLIHSRLLLNSDPKPKQLFCRHSGCWNYCKRSEIKVTVLQDIWQTNRRHTGSFH